MEILGQSTRLYCVYVFGFNNIFGNFLVRSNKNLTSFHGGA